LLNRVDNNCKRAYKVVKKIKLDKKVLVVVKWSLKDDFNMVDMLDFGKQKDLEELKQWCKD
jgi:hypothetical protein